MQALGQVLWRCLTWIWCCPSHVFLRGRAVLFPQSVFENSLMTQKMCAPPKAMGKVTYIAPAGQYSLKVRFVSAAASLLVFAQGSSLYSCQRNPGGMPPIGVHCCCLACVSRCGKSPCAAASSRTLFSLSVFVPLFVPFFFLRTKCWSWSSRARPSSTPCSRYFMQ